jgi:hypothetical protein
LTASAGNGQVILNWNPVANASGYYVKRSLVSGGSYTVIFTNLTSTTFTNTGLANGTTYYYVVVPVPGSKSTNQIIMGIGQANGSVFYRLVYP